MYNGKTYEQIENNLPKNMNHTDKERYLKNVKEYIKLKDSNKGYKECILNTNNEIIKNYIYGIY
jgi:hypothetical protein